MAHTVTVRHPAEHPLLINHPVTCLCLALQVAYNVSWVVNILLFVAKAVAFYFSGSKAVLASLVDSMVGACHGVPHSIHRVSVMTQGVSQHPQGALRPGYAHGTVCHVRRRTRAPAHTAASTPWPRLARTHTRTHTGGSTPCQRQAHTQAHSPPHPPPPPLSGPPHPPPLTGGPSQPGCHLCG